MGRITRKQGQDAQGLFAYSMKILDSDQLKAVNNPGNTIIIAGPGSGKTRILVARAQASKGRTLALAFTRTAAAEIRHRAPKVAAMTIHSLCYRTIGKFPGDYNILLQMFLESRHKPRFDNVLVDEAQDLTAEELEVVLALKPKSLFMVGDHCQSIFGFAEALGHKVFEALKENSKVFYLTNNYRSNQLIVNRLEEVHLRQLRARGNGDVKGMAILFRTNNQMDAVADALKELGHKVHTKRLKGIHEISQKGSGIELLTIHCAKGREWKEVICWDWGERLQEHNLLYVAISRASERFTVVNSLAEVQCLTVER